MSHPTFPLYGYERFFAMDPTTSAKLAHVATLRGDIPRLLQHLPTAVLQTFNRHPKMRAVVLPGSAPDQKAMICAPLADVSELKSLLNVYECAPDEEERAEQERADAAIESSTTSQVPLLRWMEFVQAECEKPVDREKDFPFYLYVRVDKSTQTFARLILFADHYMSDPTSGTIILCEILETVANLSNSVPTDATSELPLRESLYEATHYVNPWMNVFHEAVSKYVMQPLMNFDTSAFAPVLPIQTATQQDFAGTPPTPQNPSFALFGQGSEASMRGAMARCKEEGVSLQGAIIAATTMAFGLTKHNGSLNQCTEPLQLRMDVIGDRRKEVELKALSGTIPKHSEEPVGLYSSSGNLVFTSSEGVHAHEMSFWDVARKADHEWECVLHGHELKMQSVFANETLNAENRADTGLHVTNSVLSDVAVSFLDCTDASSSPFPNEMSLAGNSVTVEDLHVYNSLPSLSSTCKLFVTSLSHFNYGLMHKLEPNFAHTLFAWLVRCTERIGEFRQQDTFAQAADRLVNGAAVVAPSDMASTVTEALEITIDDASSTTTTATVSVADEGDVVVVTTSS